jgi:hypothetical protein
MATTISKPSFFSGWTEPQSAANTNYPPVFPYNNSTQTASGHAFEMDDTPTRERVRLQHRSKTFIEMHPNGDEVHKIYGDGYEITIKDKNMLVNGSLNITVVNGDANIYTKGNFIQQVDGDYELHVKGNYTTVVEGLSSFVSQGDMKIQAGGAVGGGLTIAPGDYVSIRGDLKVNGEVSANKIFSSGRIDCYAGMSALNGGFATTFGGISVGTMAPIPLSINCAGPINSLVSMSAPLITSGISASLLSKDVINSAMRNVHFHATKVGPTSPDLVPEIMC